MYHIISLTHTMRHDKFITFWRAENRGYCYSKSLAGEYETPEKGYHDSDTNTPIKVEDADKLFQEVVYDGKPALMIPNTKEFWDKLNVRMTKDGLVKKKAVVAVVQAR